MKELHPLDYCYEALNVKIETLDNAGMEYKYIFQYLTNTYDHGTASSRDFPMEEMVCYY